jgi:hypothetical protein
LSLLYCEKDKCVFLLFFKHYFVLEFLMGDMTDMATAQLSIFLEILELSKNQLSTTFCGVKICIL